MKLEYLLCYPYLFLLGLMSIYIYIYICVCMCKRPSIRWDIDGDIHSLFVTPLWWANGELSFQRQESELIFCNGSLMDEGDLARPGPATIAGMTSLEVLFVPDHDCGRHRQLIWAHQLPPYSWGRPYFRWSQEYEKVCSFSYGCTYLIRYD